LLIAALVEVAAATAFAQNRASTPASGPTGTEEKASTPNPAARPDGSDGPLSVFVHVRVAGDAEIGDGVRLEQRSSGNGDWTAVCVAPCDAELPAVGAYRVTGDGIAPSGAFQLDRSERDMIIVHPTSRGHATGGYWAMGVGGVVALAGIAVLASVSEPSSNYDNGAAEIGPAMGAVAEKLLGGSMVVGGGIAALVGLVLALPFPRESTVETHPSDAAKAGARPAAALRLSAWTSSSPNGRTRPFAGFPVFTVRF
jgi:hypothetical protein